MLSVFNLIADNFSSKTKATQWIRVQKLKTDISLVSNIQL